MSKRLAALEKMVEKGSKDPLAWYGLALEYAGLERFDDALGTFRKLREMDPAYVPMYLMCGNLLIKLGRLPDAREWLGEGIATARGKGDTHALGELTEALEAIA